MTMTVADILVTALITTMMVFAALGVLSALLALYEAVTYRLQESRAKKLKKAGFIYDPDLGGWVRPCDNEEIGEGR